MNIANKNSFWKKIKKKKLLVFLFFLGYFILTLAIFQDYGITIDEPIHAQYGEYVGNYYLSGFQDRSCLSYANLYYYGSFVDVSCFFLQKISPWSFYVTRHLILSLFSLLGVYYTYRLAFYLSRSPYFGLLAAIFLVLTPRYFGHSFNNHKDIPFAALYVTSLYYLIYSMQFWKTKIPFSLLCKIGLFSGLLLSVKVGGFLIYCYFALFWSFYHLNNQLKKKKFTLQKKMIYSFLGPFLLSYSIMLLFWPWAQQNIIKNPLIALKYFSGSVFFFPLLFEGKMISNQDLPWYYVLKWFGMTVPLVILGGGFLFVLFFLFFKPSKKKRIEESLCLFALIFPIVYALLQQPSIYNGIRHFFFSLPLFAVIASLGFFQLKKKLPPIVQKTTFPLIIFISLLPVISWMYRSHPYQQLYFNCSVGGLKGAYNQYELDYWGGAYKEACEWLHKNEKTPPKRSKNSKWSLLIDHRHPYLFRMWKKIIFQYYVNKKNFTLATNHSSSDFILQTTCTFYSSWKIRDPNFFLLHSIKRDNISILNIYKRKP